MAQSYLLTASKYNSHKRPTSFFFFDSVASGNKYKICTHTKKKKEVICYECYILFWTALRCVIPTASFVLSCPFLTAVSILGAFVSYFKQMVHRRILVIMIQDDIK